MVTFHCNVSKSQRYTDKNISAIREQYTPSFIPHGDDAEMSLQSWIDREATRGRVHTRHVLTVVDIFQRQFGPVVPVSVIQMLPYKSVRLNGSVAIYLLKKM